MTVMWCRRFISTLQQPLYFWGLLQCIFFHSRINSICSWSEISWEAASFPAATQQSRTKVWKSKNTSINNNAVIICLLNIMQMVTVILWNCYKDIFRDFCNRFCICLLFCISEVSAYHGSFIHFIYRKTEIWQEKLSDTKI